MPTLELVPKSAPAPPAGTIPDADARERALDITQSFIVEAPAGSGKTGLLIQRFLKLLASDSVTDPGEVLAITFTRKATAEMLERVLSQLRAALADTPVASPFERTTRTLAQAVLARDRLLGWNLLDQPGRLRIRTIDSISAEIATALPLLSGAGGGQRPTDDPAPLYLEAARRTLMALGGGDARLNAALELLLLHRDGHLGNCESLIAAMLGTRDQWGELVPLSRTELDDAYLEGIILPRLDRALDLAICQALTRVSRSVPPGILERLCELASDMGHLEGYKGNPSPIALCAGKSMPPEEKSAHLEHWSALIDLLLTKDGVFRAVRGIRSDYLKFLIESHHKQELVDIIEALRHDDGLRERLCAIRSLPPAEYPREQWQVTKALFHVLSRALTELQLVFAERGECDFTEVALLARTALASDAATEDLALANFKLQHLLVDEMQDTSSGQYRFIELLTRGWDARTQTLFLVGDPKQSIYLFRQARVEGFLATLANAQLGTGQNARPLEVLRLTANFRSRPGLVRAFNEDFGAIFQQVAADGIAYLPATAVRSGTGERNWHTAAIPYLADSLQRAAVIRTQTTEHAQEIRRLLLHWRALPLPPGRTDRWKIAILVRNRRHLLPIVAALRQDEPIPFRAVEIDPLAERPEILDLLALTRALLHPADRTAWLALLRGPWCGLSFADLLRISGHDDPAHAERTLFELMDLRGAELSDDGIARLQPFWQIMSDALRLRGQLPLPQLVGRTWRAFDTPNYLTSEARANTDRFFELLETLETPVSLPRLQQRIGKLYAAPSSAADAVDLMTCTTPRDWSGISSSSPNCSARRAPTPLRCSRGWRLAPAIFPPTSSPRASWHPSPAKAARPPSSTPGCVRSMPRGKLPSANVSSMSPALGHARSCTCLPLPGAKQTARLPARRTACCRRPGPRPNRPSRTPRRPSSSCPARGPSWRWPQRPLHESSSATRSQAHRIWRTPGETRHTCPPGRCFRDRRAPSRREASAMRCTRFWICWPAVPRPEPRRRLSSAKCLAGRLAPPPSCVPTDLARRTCRASPRICCAVSETPSTIRKGFGCCNRTRGLRPRRPSPTWTVPSGLTAAFWPARSRSP